MIEVTVSPGRITAGAADLEIRLTNRGHDKCLNVIFTLKLPVGIIRLRGTDTVRAKELAPGESTTTPLRVRSDHPGCYKLTSPNFSYKDHLGRTRREYGFTAEITVDPEPSPPPEPRVGVELETTALPLAEWSTLSVRVSNLGVVDVSDLVITVSGRITTERQVAGIVLGQLEAGTSEDRSISVWAEEAGTHVPIHLDLDYSGQGRRHHERITKTISVSKTVAPASARNRAAILRILFLGANPLDTSRLRVDEEIREIQLTIKQGRERDNIAVQAVWAVRPRDITDALMEFQPNFVHFAGHGGGQEGSFAAESEGGRALVIPTNGLVKAFKTVGDDVRCVVVNACQTERLARALAVVVPCVIGMRQPVGDRSSIRFSVGFYQALAAGKPIETAFGVGVAQLMMTPEGNDATAPLLIRDHEEA
jgi:CHAT domain